MDQRDRIEPGTPHVCMCNMAPHLDGVTRNPLPLVSEILEGIQDLIDTKIKEALADARVIGDRIWDGS